FGFTGHLKDNNIRPDKGDGANYSTLFREYDAIIGRWWSADPLRAKYAGMSPYNYSSNNPIIRYDPLGSTDYKVGTEDNHETTTINDGNNDIEIYVSKNQLMQQEQLWKNEDKLNYERNLDKLSLSNGFTTFEKYGALQYSLYSGVTFLPGLEITYYSPGNKRYSDYAIEKQSPFYPIIKGNEELLESLDKFSSWLETTSNHNKFLKENVISNVRSASKIMMGIQYTTDLGKIYSSYYYKEGGFGYYFQRTSAGVLGSFTLGKIGGSVFGTAASITSAPLGPWAPAYVATSAIVGASAGVEFGKEMGYGTVDYLYKNWWK
ncbi:MAG: RHS repeat-associated core domain-containing protein, partial [Chloroflexota bacterium]